MSRLVFILIILAATVGLEGRIAESTNNVDLIIEDMLNESGHNYGEEYTIHNRNEIPIRFSIKVVDATNAKNNLLKNTIIIEPFQEIWVGTVTMDDKSLPSDWSYEILVKPD